MPPLIRKVDCVSFPVSDLDEALAFWRDRLGHELIWRSGTAAAVRLPDSEAELVLHVEDRPAAVELAVELVEEALPRFVAAGGSLVVGPFDIAIGRCAVVADPWGNQFTMLDMSKGPLDIDEHGKVRSRD